MSDSEQHNDNSAQPSPWDDSRITAYVMGELSADDATKFEKELSENVELRQAVDQADELTRQLGDLFSSEAPNTLDEQRREKILAATQTPPQTVELSRAGNGRGARRMIVGLLAAAAGVMVVVGVVAEKYHNVMVASFETDHAAEFEEMPMDEADDSSLAFDAMPETELALQQVEALERQSDTSVASGKGLAASGLGATAVTMTDDVSESPPREVAEESLFAALPVDAEANRSVQDFEVVERQASPAVRMQISRSFVPADAKASSAQPAPAQPAPAQPVPAQPAPAKPASRAYAVPVAEASGPAAPGTAPQGAATGRAAQPSPSPMPASPAPVSGGTPILSKKLSLEASRRVLGQEVKELKDEQEALPTPLARGTVTKYYKELREQHAPAPELTASSRALDFVPEGEADGLELVPRYRDGDRFEPLVENEFKQVIEHPLSTFSIDVDTASYSKVRRTLVEGRLPRPDAVRIEELVNYFGYDYDAPAKDAEDPFATDVTITSCPWNEGHRLARVAIQGKRLEPASRPPCNLVFLLDTSGSMNRPNKLPLVIEGMKMLTEQLGKEDQVAIVVYAGSAGMVLDSTPANKKRKIIKALSQLSAGGSTAGGAGIQLAYATARDHFIKEGVNRVILCTDGDFNVGIRSTDELVRLIQEESSDGIFLTALGFGMGNHNDAMMEQISGKGNGNYAFIDTANEAHKVLVHQTDATLVTIAKDVKIQIEFNPRFVSNYRLIGYENRVMAKEDFNNDKKDAGEIGAGHQVTALYELVPVADKNDQDSGVDPLKYQKSRELTEAASGNESMTVKLRYKQPDGDTSKLIELNVVDDEQSFEQSDSDLQFASAVASFGMLLRNSQFAGNWSLKDVIKTAKANLGEDEFQLRREFVELAEKAALLSGR